MTSRRTAWALIAGLLLLMLLDLLVFSSLRRVELDDPMPAPAAAPAHTSSNIEPTEAAWLAEQETRGWVPVGRFGRHWPASPVREFEDDDGILFTRADGTPHHYSGFDGYRMRVVFLQDVHGRETIVVLRSRDKRVGADMRLERD